MVDVVIAAAKRTPAGSLMGAFANTAAHELGRVAIEASLDQAGVGGADVSAHSIEVSATLDGVECRTRFGHLDVRIRSCLPDTLVMASVGCLAADVIDHPALVGQDWRVAAAGSGPDAMGLMVPRFRGRGFTPFVVRPVTGFYIRGGVDPTRLSTRVLCTYCSVQASVAPMVRGAAGVP